MAELTTDTTGEAAVSLQDTVDRGWRVVFGYLAPMVLHETNNVLTVMAGIRQLLRSGQQLSSRVGPMIDSQLERVEHLLESIRTLRGDELPADSEGMDLRVFLERLERLILLGGKGRNIASTLDCAGEVEIPRDRVEAVAVASLCLVFPLLPPRVKGARAGLRLAAGGGADGHWLILELCPSSSDALQEEELAVGQRLVEGLSGHVERLQLPDGGTRFTLRFA